MGDLSTVNRRVNGEAYTTTKPIGNIHALKVLHDNAGAGSGWHVRDVSIVDCENSDPESEKEKDLHKVPENKTDPPNGKLFSVNRWLAIDKVGG